MVLASLAVRIGIIFLLIEYRIWFAENDLVKATIWPIALVCLGWIVKGDNLKTLGFWPTDYKKDFLLITLTTLSLWLAILTIALIWNPQFLSQKDLVFKFTKHLLLYLPWALLQNLWLNGYFVDRLNAEIKNSLAVSLIAGILFALIHWPNPVLVVATLIGGAMSAYFFQRNRNLYWVALSHTILAVSLLYFLPDAWHHHLRIGPGFWLY